MVSRSRAETKRLLKAYAESKDEIAREELVKSYVPLVRSICWRFRRSTEPQEDLFQVGQMGLLKAIEKFDPQIGTSFSTLAIPEVLGAILNYLRDHGTLIKVPRKLRRNKLAVDKASDRLAPTLGRRPTISELAQTCELSPQEIDEVMKLGRTGTPRSLDEQIRPVNGTKSVALADCVGSDDLEFDLLLNRMVLTSALSILPARERTILTLKFHHGLSQRHIADIIHISQMHVSRLERSALKKLRRHLQRSSASNGLEEFA